MMAVGLFMIIFDFSSMLNPENSIIRYLNSLDGINAASAIKILGTNIFYNGYTGSRNIFYRKKLIPKYGRYKYSLYCDFIPKTVMVFLIGWLPFYNIGDVTKRVWVANLLFAIYNAYGFNNQLEACASNISPDPKERIMVRTFPIKISHLAWNIIAIIIPVFIGFCKDEWADIAVFKYILPFTFLAFAIITILLAGRIKERIPQPPLDKKVNISFWDGMTGVMYNKYKWINTIVGLLDSLGNGMLAFTTILYLYTYFFLKHHLFFLKSPWQCDRCFQPEIPIFVCFQFQFFSFRKTDTDPLVTLLIRKLFCFTDLFRSTLP